MISKNTSSRQCCQETEFEKTCWVDDSFGKIKEIASLTTIYFTSRININSTTVYLQLKHWTTKIQTFEFKIRAGYKISKQPATCWILYQMLKWNSSKSLLSYYMRTRNIYPFQSCLITASLQHEFTGLHTTSSYQKRC